MKKMTMDQKLISDPVALRGEMRKALAAISGKWKLEILWLLNQRAHLSLSEIKSAHTDGVIRRELASEECARWPEQPAVPAHPC